MSLPAQVRRQKEAADNHFKAIQDGAYGDTPAAADDGSSEAPAADNSDETPNEPTAAEQQFEAPKQEDNSYEQRYKSLQGMYNAEVPKLHAERRELSARVTHLETLLASLNTPAAKPVDAPARQVTDSDIAEYGDSIDVMRRVSREEASSAQQRIDQLEAMVRQMQTTVIPRIEQVASRQAVSADQQFWADLTMTVPDWQSINAQPAFQSWLLEVDPMSGLSRQTYLEDAQRNLDASRVATFFRTWTGNAGPAVAQPQVSAASSELQRQVAPGRGKSGAPVQGSDRKTYSRTDIATFFDDVRKGAYKGREEERARIERDIFAAQRDERIVQ